MKNTIKFTFILCLILMACDSSIEPNPSLFGRYSIFSEADDWEKNTTGEFFINASAWNGIVIQNGVSKKFGGSLKVRNENYLELFVDGDLTLANGYVDEDGLRINWKGKDGSAFRRIRK
jgi:hypothetical protein